MIMIYHVLTILAIFFVFINVSNAFASSNSDEYELRSQDHRYVLHSSGSICGHPDQEHTINQTVEMIDLRIYDNETAYATMNMSIDVYDSNDTLIGQNNQTQLELVTKKGLPLEKRILLNLVCVESPDRNQFSIREDVTVRKDAILFSEPSIFTYDQPDLKNQNWTAELVFQGLDFPTNMAILSPDDILILEKDKGTVQRIVNGNILDRPLIDLNVSGFAEEGLVGIATTDNNTTVNNPYVFLYYSESISDTAISNKSLGNHIVRYELANDKLINPKVILELPTNYRGIHNGGKLIIGPDNNLYVTVGDIGRGQWNVLTDIQTQNNKTGNSPDGTGGILRFTPSGDPVSPSVIGEEYPLNLYYAYGIRNSYGIDFDPLTGNLWDTENGDENGDEINLVEPGFNSGWSIVEGMSKFNQDFELEQLVDFKGKGKYSDPELGWHVDNGTTAVAPTAIKFLDSEKYGKEFENDMLVANFDHGHLYRFDLDENRTSLDLTGSLSDKLSDGNDDDLDNTIAKFPGGVTDVQVGPDGYIYVLSLSAKQGDCDGELAGCLVNGGMKGAIFRIVPNQ